MAAREETMRLAQIMSAGPVRELGPGRCATGARMGAPGRPG
jgi:hypothetical protein